MKKLLILVGFLLSINTLASNTERFFNFKDKDYVEIVYKKILFPARSTSIWSFKFQRIEGQLEICFNPRDRNDISIINEQINRLSNNMHTLASNFSYLKEDELVSLFSNKLDSDNNKIIITHSDGLITFCFLKEKIDYSIIYRLKDRKEFYINKGLLSNNEDIKNLIKNTIQNFIQIFN